MRRLLLVTAFGFLAVGFMSPTPAHDQHACRVEARELQKQILSVADVDVLTGIFRDAAGDHPDCLPHFQTLVDWHNSSDESAAFPFLAEDDPRHNFLGPVGWWWNTVYLDWMGGSPLMMFLFGWEIFLIPIGIGGAVIVGLGGAVIDGIGSGLAHSGRKSRDS